MEKEDLIAIKEELLQKGKEKGYLLVSEIDEKIKDTEASCDFINNELTPAHIDVLLEYQAFLREIKTQRRKILFCYYIFKCRFLGEDIDLKKFSSFKVAQYKNAIDTYIDDVFSNYGANYGVKIIRTKYGLDNGDPEDNPETLCKKIEYPYMDAFITDFSKAMYRMQKGCSAHKTLENQLRSIDRYSNISDYKMHEVNFSENEVGLMFEPQHLKENYVGPFACYYPEDESRQIGWILRPTYFAHTITFYGDKVWGLRFYNSKRPNPHLHFEDGKLHFELYYPNIGYHGNRYILETNKPTIVETYDKGKLIKTTTIDFKIDIPFEDIFSFEKFDECECKNINGKNSRYFVGWEDRDDKLTTKVLDNGNVIFGRSIEGVFSGTTILYDATDDEFVYRNIKDGKPIPNSPILTLEDYEGDQKIRLTLFRENGNRCVFFFEPTQLLDSLFYGELDKNDKILNSACLSNPFFKKAIEQEPAVLADDDPLGTLNGLIGLESVKTQIERLKALCHKNKDNLSKINLNMVFSGNPGTGKTIVARLLAGILYKEKILPTNNFIEVDRSGLVAKYEGQTEALVQELIKKAMGGVLFIDEAYALYSRWGEEGNDYGRVALDALVKAMEDNRGKMCFIFAGYKEPMMRMMNMNQGFKSRVNRFIDFTDYNQDELKLIGEKFAKDNGYILDDKVIDEITQMVVEQKDEKSFANARTMRNILESLYEIQAVRTYEQTDDMHITLDDVNAYQKDVHYSKPKTELEKAQISIAKIEEWSKQVSNVVIDEKYIQESSVNIKNYVDGQVVSEGTGFFISPDGIIGTCAHVVKDSKEVKVVVNIFTSKGKRIGKSYDATILGLDDRTDVALIKIKNPDLDFSYYPLAYSDYNPNLMNEVIMGGYPLGGERFKNISLNEGKIQSINKDVAIEKEEDIDRVYVDMTGNSGNSGGGVIDKSINQCIGVYAGGSIGYSGPVVMKLNYAIHIKYLWDLINKLSEVKNNAN